MNHMTALSTDTQFDSREHWPAKVTSAISAWSALPLRLVIGYGFMVHGYAKLSRGPDSFAVVLHTLGVPVPLFLSWVTTLTELAGGFLILVGGFVAATSLPLAIVLLTALFTVHLPYGFFSVKLVEVSENGVKFGPVGYEHILLYLAGLMTLAMRGAGPVSIDGWRKSSRFRSN
jgi:putative oxidoreductase